jgi:hypothetical protein
MSKTRARAPRSSPTQRVKNPNATGANNRSNNKNNNQNNRKVVTQRVSAQRYPPARPPKNNNVSRNNANSGLSTSTTTLQRNSLKIPMTLIAWASSPQCEAHLNNINNTVGVEVSLALFFLFFFSPMFEISEYLFSVCLAQLTPNRACGSSSAAAACFVSFAPVPP